MSWSQLICDNVVNNTSTKGSYIRQLFVNVIPVADGPNTGISTLVFHNDKKGSPIGKGKKAKETYGPGYTLIREIEGQAVP